ncbi:hypothetical protein ACVOMS_10085 [Bradyrhizobium guangxiense]
MTDTDFLQADEQALAQRFIDNGFVTTPADDRAGLDRIQRRAAEPRGGLSQAAAQQRSLCDAGQHPHAGERGRSQRPAAARLQRPQRRALVPADLFPLGALDDRDHRRQRASACSAASI